MVRYRGKGDGGIALIFVAAESRELRGLLRYVKGRKETRGLIESLWSGALNGAEARLAANGPGPALARTAVEAAFELRETVVEGIVSIGYCGALDESLRRCDIFVASDVNGGKTDMPVCSRPFHRGALCSADRVVITAREKAELRRTGARAVEMEAMGVGGAARDWGVPFFCVRVVTDTAGEDLPLDFNEFRDECGRFSRRKIAVEAIKNPGLIPGLMNIDRVAKRASIALGDFLADCQF
jgi:nucleoside phosphorylase